MQTNDISMLARRSRAAQTRVAGASRTCAICAAGGRLFAAAVFTLGVAYAPSLVGTLMAWWLG